jgi:hypothetical protein
MLLHQIAQIVNSAEGMLEKLSVSQVSTFLNVVEKDVQLAEHVLEIIQTAHGLGLEDTLPEPVPQPEPGK